MKSSLRDCCCLVLGSGIGGLAAGAELKRRGQDEFLVVDRCSSLPLNLSNGVHYLHDAELGLPFDFPLKEISTTEEIWNPRKDEFKKLAHIPDMIDYSLKVMGLRHPSSISDPGNREWKTFLPISNNMNDLLVAFEEYIGKDNFCFGQTLTKIDHERNYALFKDGDGKETCVHYRTIISTIPMPVMEGACDVDLKATFTSKPIYITNYPTENIVPNWLISIYVSDEKFPPYRITILNNILSMESLVELTPRDEVIVKYHLERYFQYDLNVVNKSVWPTGRIWGLDKPTRDRIVSWFNTIGIYPLGRFGQWNGKLTMDTTIKQAQEIVSKL